MLSAQTTDKRVNEVTNVLFNKYDNLSKLKNADIKDLETIIYPLGNYRKKAYNVKEIARILDEEYMGKVPQDRNLLEKLPGVGRKTVNVYYAEYLNIPAIAVDTHVERVCKRLNIAKEKDNVLIIEKKLMKNINKENWSKRHLQLVLFGRYHCKAKKPECANCKLKEICKEYK
jgi:endonuclease-3